MADVMDWLTPDDKHPTITAIDLTRNAIREEKAKVKAEIVRLHNLLEDEQETLELLDRADNEMGTARAILFENMWKE